MYTKANRATKNRDNTITISADKSSIEAQIFLTLFDICWIMGRV
jgi:hypothetical protein